jgi:hypothetical protein
MKNMIFTLVTSMISLAAFAQPSGPGSALLVDGISGSYVSIATTGSLTGTFTVELWANSSDPTGNNATVSSRFVPQGEYSFDFGLRNANEIHGDIGNGSSWITINADAYFPYVTGVWHHLAYVVTPAGYSIYGDGVLAGFGGVGESDAVLYDSAHGLGIGGNASTPTWNGLIDEVRIWCTARSQQEVQAKMYRTLTGTEIGLMGYWRFDEGNGTNTVDASGHGFTGTLLNGVSWVGSSAPISNAPVMVVVPSLAISPGDGAVLVSWPTNAGGFVLETCSTLGAGQSWSIFPGPVHVFGDQNVIAADAANRSQFFRLRNP